MINKNDIRIIYDQGPFSLFENNCYKFKYSEQKCKNIEYIVIDDFIPLNNEITFPTTINNKPVVGIRFSNSSDLKPDFITKITIGGNLLELSRFSKVFENLEAVDILDNLDIKKENLYDLLRYARYSKRKCSFSIPKKFNINQKNDCLLIDNDKTLIFWYGKDNKLVIPDSVEKLSENSITGKQKLNFQIIWSKNLKIVEDRAITINTIDFLKYHKFPETIEYAGDCCILGGTLPQRVNALVYEEKSKLIIADNVKELSNNLVRQIFATEAGKYKNFIYSNGLLMSKDKKILYLAFSEKDAEKEIIIPDSIEKILPYAFFRKRYLKTIVTKDSAMFTKCCFDFHVQNNINFSVIGEKKHKNINIYTKKESELSLKEFEKYLKSLCLSSIVKVNAENFDDFIKEIETITKPINLNFMNLRRDMKEMRDFKIFADTEFMSCCEDNYDLYLYFVSSLQKNGIFHDDIDNSDNLIKFIQSNDFDGVSSDLTSNIYLIKNDKFGRKALIIGDTRNIPKAFISKNIFKSTKSTFFADFFDI